MFIRNVWVMGAYILKHLEYSFRAWLRKPVVKLTTSVGQRRFFNMENYERGGRLFGKILSVDKCRVASC
jgi:hypothetical protein